jgi:hypothetical protein
MEPASRTRLVALAVLLAISVPLVVIAAGGGGSEDTAEDGGLRVEPSKQGLPEVVLYLEDAAVNTPETTGGANEVRIACTDRGGAVVFRGAERWPFSDTDGGEFDPHVHVAVDPAVLGKISRCSLVGTDPPVEGGRPKRR